MDWDEIHRKIGSKKVLNWRLIKPELAAMSANFKIGNLLKREEVEKLKDIWQSTEPFSDENGNPFVLYIFDRSYINRFFKKYVGGYKFHFKWCHTLKRMDDIGRGPRYKAKWDIESPFFSSSQGGSEKLYVCKYCLNSFSFDGNRKPTPQEFNIKDFFDAFGEQKLKQPTHQHYMNKYTKNWGERSKRYKNSKSWCVGCFNFCSPKASKKSLILNSCGVGLRFPSNEKEFRQYLQTYNFSLPP